MVTGIVGAPSIFIHRLVAHAFLGPPPSPNFIVSHRDGDVSNNSVVNLEYVTHGQVAKRSSQTDRSRKTGVAVLGRVSGSRDWIPYSSIREAARELSISASTVSRLCCTGKQHSAHGFEFKFALSTGTGHTDIGLPGERWCTVVDPQTGLCLSGWSVSTAGRVRNTRQSTSWGTQHRTGYMVVCIRQRGHAQQFLVHRLVARAFLGPPQSVDLEHVHHKDGDKTNNNVDNLEYVTPSQNTRYSYSSNPGQRVRARQWKPVWGRRLGTTDWMWFHSLSEAATKLNLRTGGISLCLRGRCRQTGGFEFQLAQPRLPALLPGEEWREIAVKLR